MRSSDSYPNKFSSLCPIMVTLLDLPPEVLVACLSSLPLRDIRACFSAGNQLICRLLAESLSVRYRVAQEAAGLVENACVWSNVPTADRLQYLQDKERRWLSFSPQSRHTIEIDFPHTGFYALAADIYCRWRKPDPTTGIGTELAYISTSPGRYPQQWHTIDAGGKPILDAVFAWDDYGLIAIVTCAPRTDDPSKTSVEVQPLCFPTGSPHPFSKNLSFHVCDVPSALEEPAISCDIAGRTLAISLLFSGADNADNNGLYLYDWQLGLRIMDRIPITEASILFLAPDILIIPNLSNSGFNLDLLRLPPASDEPQRAPIMKTLQFPQLSPQVSPVVARCQSEISEPSLTHPSNLRFLSAAADSAILVSFSTHSIEGEPQALRDHLFVICRALFLETIHQLHLWQDVDVNVSIAWSAWGPRCARWLDAAPLSDADTTLMAGQRMVVISRETPSPIRMLDFNRSVVRDCRAHGPADLPHASVRVVEGDSDGSEAVSCGAHSERVQSDVAYVEVTSKELFSYGAVLMNNESILGVLYDDEGRIKSVEVLHFG